MGRRGEARQASRKAAWASDQVKTRHRLQRKWHVIINREIEDTNHRQQPGRGRELGCQG